MEIHQIRSLLLHYSKANSSGKEFSFPEGLFKAFVKGLMHKDVILSINGKEVLVRNEAGLRPGEYLTLKANPKDSGVELQIQQRTNFSGSSFSMLSRITESPESFLNRIIPKEGTVFEEKIFSLLNSYFPALDWESDTRYFYWSSEENEGTGFLGKKDKEKRFYLRLESSSLGKLETLFRWQKEDLEDLQIDIWAKNLSVYLEISERKEKLEEMFSDLGLDNLGIHIHWKNWDQISSGWKV